ncbi:MAG: hypothetical protein AABZ53_00070 [Planctomycetota bacterium]
MPRSKSDSSLTRHEIDAFKFPLGVYPVEELAPKPGYTLDFEAGDGDESDGDWEEWPDRYVFDAVLSAERVPALVRTILALMPNKVYPILDILGHDAFREIDPYVSYELVGLDRLVEAIRQVPDFFFEDGLCGFGAMSQEPFIYFFVDEHKIVTIRAEAPLREKIEKVLAAFDLEHREDAAGVDAAAHEHRTILVAPDTEAHLMSFDEIVEQLHDDWRLVLNIDPETNVDEEGKELGVCAWWCRVRVSLPQNAKDSPHDPAGSTDSPESGPPSHRRPTRALPPAAHDGPKGEEVEKEESQDDDPPPPPWEPRYIEVLLTAENLREAEDTAVESALKLAGPEADVEGLPPPVAVFTDRLTPEQLEESLTKVGKKKIPKGPMVPGRVLSARWLR